MLTARGESLLMLSSYHGHPELTRVLLSFGADTELLNDKGQSCLAGAVFKGYEEVVQVLLDAGADPQGGTPDAIGMAEMFKRERIGEMLKEALNKRAARSAGLSSAV